MKETRPTDYGGPAFPYVKPEAWCEAFTGMTLRDYFAAKAMQGLIESGQMHEIGTNMIDDEGASAAEAIDESFRFTAFMAFGIAEAMIAARDK